VRLQAKGPSILRETSRLRVTAIFILEVSLGRFVFLTTLFLFLALTNL